MRAVTFDLWHTLVYDTKEMNEFWTNGRVYGMLEILNASGYQLERNAILEAYARSGSIFEERRHSNNKEIDVPEQIEIFLSLLKIEPESELIARLTKPYAEILLCKLPLVIAGAEECLKALKREGYRLGLISNTGRTPGRVLRQMLHEIKLAGYFDHMTFSNEIQIRKPHIIPFCQTLKHLSVKAGDAVHIGDHLKSDIYGAKNAGMKAILYKPLSKMEPVSVEPDAAVDSLESIVEIVERIF